MVKTIFVSDKKYIITGCIESKKNKILLAYDHEIRQTHFFIEKKNILGHIQYVKVNEKTNDTLNSIFNRVENDLLYSKKANGTLEWFDFSKYEEKNIDDEKYKELFKEALKQVINRIKEYFPECNSENLNKRLPTLKVELVSELPESINAYFSRWKNTIYISRKCFKNPKLLINVLCHELFHVIGTETEMSKSGTLKKGISRNTGFETKLSYGKGINEGFVQKYANTITTEINIHLFEVRVADLIEVIFDNDLAKENSSSNVDVLYSLTKDSSELIKFIKLVDNYHMLKTRYIDAENIEDKKVVKYNFIQEIENLLIEFFFEKLKGEIKEKVYHKKESVFEKIRLFKEKLVFLENINSQLEIDEEELLGNFESVKSNFIIKLKDIEGYVEKYIVSQRHEKDLKILKEIKKITKYTFNITDVLEILDESFRKSLDLEESQKVYLLAQRMDNKRKFFVVVKDKENCIKEILNDDIEVMTELKDATVYDNLNISDEAREKERRHTHDRTFSIYRKIDGNFGIADLVDKENKILRSLKTLNISIPFHLIDDSLEDFTYLNDYLKPNINIDFTSKEEI